MSACGVSRLCGSGTPLIGQCYVAQFLATKVTARRKHLIGNSRGSFSRPLFCLAFDPFITPSLFCTCGHLFHISHLTIAAFARLLAPVLASDKSCFFSISAASSTAQECRTRRATTWCCPCPPTMATPMRIARPRLHPFSRLPGQNQTR